MPGRRPTNDRESALAEFEHHRARLAAALSDPVDAFVIGEPVTLLSIDFDGNVRRGLTATVRHRGALHAVALADVTAPEGTTLAGALAEYRAWLGMESTSEPAPVERRRHKAELADVEPGHPIDLVVLAVKERTARCRLVGSAREITLRTAGLWNLIPGDIATIEPRKQWSYAGHPYVSGEVRSTRLDVAALGLVPLRLAPHDMWNPREEYWGDEGDPLEPWAQQIVARGPRPAFEMEHVIPGADPDDWDSDPILDAVELNESGKTSDAWTKVMGLLERDLRCLDGHAHLGNWEFDTAPSRAIRHYEAGVRIGELSLGPEFSGVLPWGLVDNRPFLRCLHGYALSLWRLGRADEAAPVFERLLWLNPSDNQGERFNLAAVRRGKTWEESEDALPRGDHGSP